MDVLDLFCGAGGWSAAFTERGHNVTTLDIEPCFRPDIIMDILKVSAIRDLGEFDVILASPPCERFSIAASWLHHWQKTENGYVPTNEKAELALDIARHTFGLLEKSSAAFYVIENPRGYMRHLIKMPDAQVNYCKYAPEGVKGFSKPTDLWGKLPPSFIPLRCSAGNGDHVYAGGHKSFQYSTSGIRKAALSSAKRALIPHGLSLAMCIAMENDL